MTAHPRRDCTCPRARHQHGSYGGYSVDRCRCTECRAAKAARQASDRRRLAVTRWNEGRGTLRVNAIGTQRRLQALAAMGWSLRQIAERLGVTIRAVAYLREQYTHIQPDLARRVAAIYDELWDKRPTNPQAEKVRHVARAHGWLPPLAWDDDSIDDPSALVATAATSAVDDVAIERAMHGDPVRLTKAEEAEVVARLTRRGLSAREIAGRIGRTSRTVHRKRAA